MAERRSLICCKKQSPTQRPTFGPSASRWRHAKLSGICARISFESAFYPLKRPLIEAERRQCNHLFHVLEGYLKQNAGPYLFGDLPLADLALTPTVIRLTRHGASFADASRARSWAARLLERPDVQIWMAEAEQLEHILVRRLSRGSRGHRVEPVAAPEDHPVA